MEVIQTLGVGAGAGGVAELHVGALLGGLDHVVLMAEGVGKDHIAAVVHQVHGGLVALLALGDVGLGHVIDAQLFAGQLGRVDEVEVIGRVFVVQEDEAHFHSVAGGDVLVAGAGGVGALLLVILLIVVVRLRIVVLGSAGGQTQAQNRGQEQSEKLFHVRFPPNDPWLI